MVFLEFRRDSRVMTGNSGFLLCWPREDQSSIRVARESWGCSRVTAGQKRPHLGFCPGDNVPLEGLQGSQGCIPDSSGSQVSSRGEAKDSAFLSSHDGYFLEPTEWRKGSQASCGVWREDLGMLSRPRRKRRPSSRDDGGVSWVFSSCGASVEFLTKYLGELRKPLVWRQGSKVSMRVARGARQCF